jgi:predicted O-methyltransferase YrrM
MTDQYKFSTDWFSNHTILWEKLIELIQPKKVLEIGSFEGRATTFIIEHAGKYNPVDIYCVDTWKGGREHTGIDFDRVQRWFDYNCEKATQNAKNPVRVIKIMDTSAVGISKLIVSGITDFDLVYVDGSHVASDVFLDAAFAFHMTRVGGAIIFDDFKQDDADPYGYPKIAIQAFEGVHFNKIKHFSFYNDGDPIPEDKLYQRYYWKTSK